MKKAKLHIGTSGWHYDHWIGPFYPEGTAKSDMLACYRSRFSTAEINNSFYRLPEAAALKQWRETVGRNFTFAVKASRYITHMKKLKDPTGPWKSFIERMSALGDALGPILFQLPPRWKRNPGRLREFLERLNGRHRCAFEFRDESWFDDEIYRILEEHNAAFCIYHLAGRLSPKTITSDWVYVRLHGPGEAYRGRYDNRALAGWAGAFSTWLGQGRDVYCYFDNDDSGHAPNDALRLAEMMKARS